MFPIFNDIPISHDFEDSRAPIIQVQLPRDRDPDKNPAASILKATTWQHFPHLDSVQGIDGFQAQLCRDPLRVSKNLLTGSSTWSRFTSI